MSKPLSPAAHAYLQKLRNPYATEQLEDSAATQPLRVMEVAPSNSTLPTSTRPEDNENPELGIYQDPYAFASEEQRHHKPRALRAVATSTCSKTAFRSGCTRIFRYYTPAPEKGVLADEHTAFIARNENHPSEVRYALLRELQRCDLSDVSGIRPQLNREKDALTEVKLRALELKVLGKK